jgi:NitT/TauT family transport system substrate-binding protein
MTIKTRLAALGLTTALIASAVPRAQAAEKVTYLLPAPAALIAFAPWMLAKHLKYYDDAGYDVEFQVARGGVDVAKQVGAGNAVIGGALGDTSMIVRPNGVPVKSVGVMGGGALTVVVARKDRGISKLEDLKGKTVTVLAFQDTTYYAFLGALASVNLKKSDVNAEAAGPAGITSLVIAGKADACACVPDWEIMVRDGLGAANTISFPTLDYFPSMSQAIIAADDVIKSKPQLVKGLVQATIKGMKFIMDEPKKAAAAYAEAVPSWKGKEGDVERILMNFTDRTYKGQKTPGEMDESRLTKLQDFYVKEGIVPKAVPLAELYTNQFIR